MQKEPAGVENVAAVRRQGDHKGQCLHREAFVWGVGIESSSLPHLNIDQFEWTQHNRLWRDDLRMVREDLGLEWLRYSIPWHYIQPSPNKFNWDLADQRIGFCRDLGLELILDVMHFGTPLWLPQAVGSPEFPEALERFTEAMVSRYSGDVRVWCPINEPLVTALFSGDFGFWPPHSRRWRGYLPVLARIAIATSRAIRAIRRVQGEATVLLCDAADHFVARDESLQQEATLRNLRRFLLLDLIGGRVDQRHPLHEWLTAYGMTELDLQWLASQPQRPDVIGLDYYPHSEWELLRGSRGILQRRSPTPLGLSGIAAEYYQRYALPMMVTETSIEGPQINREIWLEQIVEDARRLRKGGTPLVGMCWWPLLDHFDWDGAMTHHIGKIHQVGLYKLVRHGNVYKRVRTSVASMLSRMRRAGNSCVGEIESLVVPYRQDMGVEVALAEQTATAAGAIAPPAGEVDAPKVAIATAPAGSAGGNGDSEVATESCGIVVFSHLRWGFVWQRPQQFLSRLARKHPVLFIEEPMLDLGDGAEPDMRLHQVMPNVTVACAHLPASWSDRPDVGEVLRHTTRQALSAVNTGGGFTHPLLWYYNPLDSLWSLGHIPGRAVVYDCMDELAQFSGASDNLVAAEHWLMKNSDIVFTGGRRLWEKKSRDHQNVHFFGCGVEFDHFAQAMDPEVAVPPDIDFMSRPILGWFGVIDERLNYALIAEVARRRPDWSLAMIGPVVKMDPNLLPHSPNLFWLGERNYSVLPNYCKAFDLCMMCFAVNGATEYINPTKALEYLATGRPVVSTPVHDIVAQYAGLVDIAATPEEFVAAAERAISAADAKRIEAGLARARESTWDATVQKMRQLIIDSAEKRARLGAVAVEKADDSVLAYRYVHVTGS